MATEGEDVASADGAMAQWGGQLDNGRIGQCHHEAIGKWPLEQYDAETFATCQHGCTGNRDHGHWDTGSMCWLDGVDVFGTCVEQLHWAATESNQSSCTMASIF